LATTVLTTVSNLAKKPITDITPQGFISLFREWSPPQMLIFAVGAQSYGMVIQYEKIHPSQK
jgi:hypothetical protein